MLSRIVTSDENGYTIMRPRRKEPPCIGNISWPQRKVITGDTIDQETHVVGILGLSKATTNRIQATVQLGQSSGLDVPCVKRGTRWKLSLLTQPSDSVRALINNTVNSLRTATHRTASFPIDDHNWFAGHSSRFSTSTTTETEAGPTSCPQWIFNLLPLA